MKKSKFLKSSKDMMLSRSFNPAKCKTSLRLAGSRLKLLKNKKDVQVKQMRREIAQLLETGQDQTARIRVEHVIREEKMMAAYELIELYCELIVARLPIIETQKNCPIDLKEAITSVIFASPRCGDVPELLDVRKHFTAKYGKDFTTAAIELRPECGVGRMLVEKLSAVAPDGQTKIKILSAIAEEHNVKWDQKSFEEKDSAPRSDLLSGPSTFAPSIQPSQVNNNSPLNFSQHDHKNSLGTEKLTPPQTSNVSTTFQPEATSPGGDRAQFFQGDRQRRWNMEFKDATSAAQAAAESAEMASMAARAAAELSRQYSTDSHNSHASYIVKDEHVNSKLASKQFPDESANSSSSEIDEVKPNQLHTSGSRGKKEYNQSGSLKSKSKKDDSVHVLDGYSRKNSLKEVSKGETSIKKESFKYKAEEKPENFIKQRSGKLHSANSSRSGSSISDYANVYSNSEDQKVVYDSVPVLDGYSRKNSLKEVSKGEASVKKESFKYKAEEKPENFIKQRSGELHSANSSRSGSSISDYANVYSHSEDQKVIFDNYDSDSQLHEFDVGPKYDDHESEFQWPSSRQMSPKHLSANTDSWSPRSSSSKIANSTSPSPFVTTKNSSFDFAEKSSIDGLEKDVTTPLVFDDSDGPSSESEQELTMSSHTATRHSTDLIGKSVGSTLKEKHSSRFNNKQSSLSSDDDLKPDEVHRENGAGLSYLKKTTGGLRHKGYNQPPYLKNQLNTSVQEGSPKMKSTLENKKSIKKPDHHSEPDSDSSEEEEYLQKKHELYTRRAGKEVKIKPSLRASNSVFDSDDSDLDDNPPKESITRKSHVQSGVSRRTKASPSTGKTSYYKTQSIDFDDISETPKKMESPKKSSKLENHEQPMLAKVASKPAKSNYWGPPEPFNSPVANSESKTRVRHDSHDYDVSVVRKPTNSSQLGNSESISRVKKPSSPPTGKSAYSKTQLSSESIDFDDISETPKKVESPRKSSKLETAKVASKPAKSNYWGPPEPYNSAIANPESKIHARHDSHDSNVSQLGNSESKVASNATNSNSRVEKPSRVEPKIAELKKTNSNVEDKKASHVHPKLPDYDSLVQTLRMKRS